MRVNRKSKEQYDNKLLFKLKRIFYYSHARSCVCLFKYFTLILRATPF